MPTIAMRKIDANGNPLAGNGFNSFVYDLDAVAQLIMTRLRMFQGEWWANLSDGLPLFQSILGVGGAGKAGDGQVIANIIQNRIALTPYVANIQDVAISYQPGIRTYQFQCTVITTFGTLQVCVGPGSQATVSGSSY